MTLRPIKAKHSSIRRSRRYARLTSNHGHWGEFKPRNIFKPNGEFNPFFSSRKGKAVLLLSIMIIGLLAFDQIAKYTTPAAQVNPSHPSPLDPDIVTPLWSATSPNSDNSEFNINSRVAFASGSLWTASKALRLQPNGTSNGYALALSKTSFDPSTVSGKHLRLFYFWKLITRTSWVTGQRFYMYLTRNSTLPGTAVYDPKDDKNVALLLTFEPQGSDYIGFVFIQKNPSETVQQEDYGSCSSTSSCFIQQSILQSNGAYNPASQANQMGYWLNFTGTSTALTNICAGGGALPQGGSGCSPMILTPGGTVRPDTGSSGPNGQLVPALTFQAQSYYVGFYWPGVSNVVADFGYDSGNNNMPCQVDPNAVICTGVHSMQIGSAQILSTPVPIAPTLDTGGWFGPVIKALINIGVFIINGILSFAGFLGPSLKLFVATVETFYVALIDIIGNLIWPGSNLGTAIANELGNFVSWMVDSNNGLLAAFGNSTAIFSRFVDVLKVTFPWLPTALAIAANLATLAINSITELLTLVTLSMTLIVGGFSFYLIFFFFIYTGDDSLGGALGFLETTQFLIFNLGLAWTARISNYGIDIITAIVGLIPKPFVQMVAHRIPRLPIIESNASFVNPSMDFAEARSGNAFVFALWAVGLDFLAWYESRNPALPGSIGALIPGAVNPLLALNGMLPFLNLIVIISWGACIAFIGTRALSLAGADLFEIPVPIGPGRKISSGPKGFRISRGSKHLQGRLEKQFGRNKRGESVIKGGKEGKKAQQEQRNEEKEKAERIQEERTNQED